MWYCIFCSALFSNSWTVLSTQLSHPPTQLKFSLLLGKWGTYLLENSTISKTSWLVFTVTLLRAHSSIFLSHTHHFSYCMYILKAFSISTLHLAAALQREPCRGSPSPRGSLGSPSLLSKTFILATCLQRTRDISKDLSHPWHKLFDFLLSGKKAKKRMKTETTTFLNSCCWLVTDQLRHFPSYSKFTKYLISTWSCNCSSPDSSAPFHLCGHLPPGSYIIIYFF